MRNHADIVAELLNRWPENRVAPTLGRVAALLDLLGSPHRSAPVVQIAGTNGKGSTAIMVDALLRSAGLRTGRFTSPHLSDVTERICIDGRPIETDRFDELWTSVRPLVEIVDEQRIDGVRMTFFEVVTCLAFAAFADAPVDVMVLEVGLGGTWDATNAADADVAVVCPVDLDHRHILGDTVAEIAGEKAGIIKPGSTAVLAGQQPEAAAVLLARCAEVGAPALREGIDFGLLDRTPAVGGQVIRVLGAGGPIPDLFLPLHGAHMAANAALAVAAAEALLGGRALAAEVVADGLADVRAPARLELVRTSPPVVLDTAHNPHGVRATLAAVNEAYGFAPTIGVLAMMRDKDAAGVLALLEPEIGTLVVTGMRDVDRAYAAAELAELAAEAFGADRVRVAPSMQDAIEVAVELADEDGPGAGVLIVGSVIAAGEARTLLVKDEGADDAAS
ncbi:bifunctional folylpolyglutamate synthase/dihydrofolate synthase [Propionicicella superfundia]|uniref:bifunctional folylpolyglutamate synthase/dihydrofolate synthase n=1 Tax=Propionicicella superfundia TaxID=348582 RepID=UPI000413FF4C|nr:folylpolyglutamate synthase/dihydrofolate synthase family protein [Propionicicella superfundia]